MRLRQRACYTAVVGLGVALAVLVWSSLVFQGCGHHRSSQPPAPRYTYAFSVGLNEFEVEQGFTPSELDSLRLSAEHWINNPHPHGMPTGFRWAWWIGEPGTTSVDGNRVEGWRIRVSRQPFAGKHAAHAGSQGFLLGDEADRPTLYLQAGPSFTLPEFGHALLHVENLWDGGDRYDWHHQATSLNGWPTNWALAFDWAGRAAP